MLAQLSKRFAFALLLMMILSVCQAPAIAASSFTDVPASYWAYNEIVEAVNKGITNGYSDGTFKPGNSVTNAHFSAFLARAFYSSEYTDGSASPWYQPYTDTLDSHDVYEKPSFMTGVDTIGANKPENVNKAINRYDMAMMMYNILVDKDAEMPTNAELATARNAIGDWNNIPAEYRGAVSLCYAMGVLNGQKDGTFGGSNLMNRAQGCVVVYRLTQKLENGDTGLEPTEPTKPIEPTEPEQPSNPSSSQTLTNGKAVTEDNVLEIIEELKVKYPKNSTYDPYNPKYYFKAMGVNGVECAKLAYMLSDEIFGVDAPIRSHTNYDDIKVGDIIEHKDDNGKTFHWSVVQDSGIAPSGSAYIRTVDGGAAGTISWNGIDDIKYFDNETVWTRYPA